MFDHARALKQKHGKAYSGSLIMLLSQNHKQRKRQFGVHTKYG